MRSFFKIFFASLLALLVFVFLAFVVLLIVISSATSREKPDIGSKGVLVLDISRNFDEQGKKDAVGSFTGDASADVPGLYDVVRLLHHAKSDSAIKGLLIKAEDNPNGLRYQRRTHQSHQRF